MDGPIRKIIIAGGGTAGWMSAAALRAGLPAEIEIELIESEEIGIIGVGEATIPTIRAFNEHIGLDEAAFIRETEASFKLGIEFQGWGREDSHYFHGFGDFGAMYEGLSPHQIWRKLNLAGDETPLEAYSLATQLARQNRFFPPNPDPRSPMHDYSYAFHFDASLYAKFLRAHCEARGVKRRNARIVDVGLRADDGFINHLKLDDGTVAEADFFIDCTGFRGLLIEGALKSGYTDWSSYLPVNRAWAMPCSNEGPLTPYTTSIARKAGWQWRIPLQHRTGNGYVFSSDFISEDEARQTLIDSLPGKVLKDPMLIKFTTGHRNQFWNRNCICVGLASGFLEPLESTSINLIQVAVTRLLELFPSRKPNPGLVREYNYRVQQSYERVRDFIILHYVLNDRHDGDLWAYTRNMPISDDLAYKLERYRHRGDVIMYKFDHFAEPSWISVLHGQGVRAEVYDPLVDRVDLSQLRTMMHDRKTAIDGVVAKLPTHEAFIAAHCASPNFATMARA